MVTNSLGVSASPLSVPTLVATPFYLRAFQMGDLGLVAESSRDPHIPLITTVPAVLSESAGAEFIERQWRRARHGEGYPFVIAEDGTDRSARNDATCSYTRVFRATCRSKGRCRSGASAEDRGLEPQRRSAHRLSKPRRPLAG